MVSSRRIFKEIRKHFILMASVGVAPASGMREPSNHNVGVDRLPEEMNDMKIRDDKVRSWFGISLSYYFLVFT